MILVSGKLRSDTWEHPRSKQPRLVLTGDLIEFVRLCEPGPLKDNARSESRATGNKAGNPRENNRP